METTSIPPNLNIDRLGDQFLITVQVGRGRYNGSFDGLTFGENKPQLGQYRNGWLELVYYHNPGLKGRDDVPALDDSVSEPSTDIPAP